VPSGQARPYGDFRLFVDISTAENSDGGSAGKMLRQAMSAVFIWIAEQGGWSILILLTIGNLAGQDRVEDRRGCCSCVDWI
jgi:hypothetical protein